MATIFIRHKWFIHGVILIVCSGSACYSQVKATLYYNDNWFICSSKNTGAAKHYRECTVDTAQGGFTGSFTDYRYVQTERKYYKEKMGSYKGLRKHGKFTFYNSFNHKKLVEGRYVEGQKAGVWKGYYMNGKLSHKIEFTNDDHYTVIASYDTTGKPDGARDANYLSPATISIGSEGYERTFDHGDKALALEYPYMKNFPQNKYLAQVRERKKGFDDRIYISVDLHAEPDGGLIKYVKSLARAGSCGAKKKGVVFLQVVINKEGVVTKASIIQDAEKIGCEALENAILSGGKWKPARLDGEPVNSMTVLAVAFEGN